MKNLQLLKADLVSDSGEIDREKKKKKALFGFVNIEETMV